MNFQPYKLDRTQLPDYSQFAQSCYRGLSAVYSFKDGVSEDPQGWKFGKCRPPSHPALGRMRALLAVKDALRLKPGKALEVAAGGGGLATCLVATGCDVVVNDLREKEITVSLSEFRNGERIKVESGNVFDLSSEQIGRFDLVVACEIIEHVAHPGELLAHLRSFLKSDARLLLTTPNGSYFRNKLPTYAEVEDLDDLEARQFRPDADGHLFLLTPGELSGLAASAGLLVERLCVWGTPMLSGHAAFRYLAGLPLLRASYLTERLTQFLPAAARERTCALLSATLRLA